MKCPNCNETLIMTDKQGVEIDYCPKCRGVWLDRGELDKLIERSSGYTMGSNPDRYDDDKKFYPPQQGGHYHDPYKDPHYKHKKKKGFLDDFFDF